MIVDGHMHLWERIAGSIANETPVRPLRNGMILIGDKEYLGMPAWLLDCRALAEYAIAEFDAAGVDVGVVVQDYMDGQQNEYLLQVAKAWPDRFFLHALPNFWDTNETCNEVQQLLQKGFRGIKVPATHMISKVLLDDPRLMVLWELMESEGIVAAIDLGSDVKQTEELERVLNAFPQLRVALGHFGLPTRGGWPAQLALARYPNVYLEMGGITWLYRLERYPFPGAIEAILHAKQEVGIEKLIWGSDFPRTMIDFTYQQSLNFIRSADVFSDEEQRLLLGENARRLYDLREISVRHIPATLITSL